MDIQTSTTATDQEVEHWIKRWLQLARDGMEARREDLKVHYVILTASG